MARALLAILLLAGAVTAFGATPELVAKIDDIGRQAVASGQVPGLAIGVMRGGELVAVRGYGMADLENEVAVRADSVFPIASVTKNFTAAAILQLADGGLLSLDDDVGKFLPDFPHRGRGVTVRRLLDHTGGVHSVTAIPSYWAQVGQPIEPAKLIELFRDAPLDFEPGARYAYSNSGYILLGAIVEKVTGLSYGEALRTRLFAPLGLTQTRYCGTAELIPRRVRGYARAGERFVHARHVEMSQGYAAGGVCSTVGDLLRWQHALHHGRLLEPKTYAAMTTPAAGRSYGLGVGIGSNAGHRVLFHAGGISGFDAMTTTYPDDGVEIAVLANAGGETASAVESRVARLVLGIPERAVKAVPAEELRQLLGTYRSSHGFAIRLVERAGAVYAEIDGEKPLRLHYAGGGVFFHEDGPDLVEIRGTRLLSTHYGATRFEATRAADSAQ